MLLDKILFEQIGIKALNSCRLRMNFDLRDSDEESCQRMLNVLQPGTKTTIHRHTNSSEIVACIYGSAIERLYDESGHEIDAITIVAGSDIPGIVVETGLYHSLEATNEMGVVLSVKSGHYEPMNANDILNI